MRILIISESIDNSAAGRVFKSFVESLSLRSDVELYVIANKIEKTLQTTINSSELNKSERTNSRWYKLIFSVLNFDLEGYSKVRSGRNHFIEISHSFNPDVILVLASGADYNCIDLGVKIAEEYNKPLAIHCVDPMPAPVGWGEHRFLRKAIIKYAGKRIRKANSLSYINDVMLNYQTNLLKITKKTKTFTLLNPFQYLPYNTRSKIGQKLKFLYIGSFYTQRKPDMLIQAFLRLLTVNPNAELNFVGIGDDTTVLAAAKKHHQINLLAWTDEPEKVMEANSVLIDLSADIPADVFIGSKLNNYIMYDKPILSISRIDSPTRILLKDCKNSVFYSNWSVESIYSSMLAISSTDVKSIMFEERNALRVELNISQITDKLISNLSEILS